MAECGIQVNPRFYSGDDFYADGPEGFIFGRRFDLGVFGWLIGSSLPCDLYLSGQTPGPTGETWVSIQDDVERTLQ